MYGGVQSLSFPAVQGIQLGSNYLRQPDEVVPDLFAELRERRELA